MVALLLDPAWLLRGFFPLLAVPVALGVDELALRVRLPWTGAGHMGHTGSALGKKHVRHIPAPGSSTGSGPILWTFCHSPTLRSASSWPLSS